MSEIKNHDLSEFGQDKAFDPDKRLDPALTNDFSHEYCYDPDKRLSDMDKLDSLERIKEEYMADLKSRSEYPETISDDILGSEKMERRSPEENAIMREEFDSVKAKLKEEWEAINGIPWPKYTADVYSDSGNLIRKAGSDYDAHHIIPLGLGGKNEARNITPLHAAEHYDKQGVHAQGSPYSKFNSL